KGSATTVPKSPPGATWTVASPSAIPEVPWTKNNASPPASTATTAVPVASVIALDAANVAPFAVVASGIEKPTVCPATGTPPIVSTNRTPAAPPGVVVTSLGGA